MGGVADTGVTGLDLVGLYIDNIVLLQVVIRRIDDVGIVEVEGMDFLSAIGIFADELDAVADAIDRQVASLSQGLENGDLLIADVEHTGTVDLAEDGDLVVGHAYSDHGVLRFIQIGLDLVVDHLLAHGLREATDLERTEDREFNAAFIIDQIGLKSAAATNILVYRGRV